VEVYCSLFPSIAGKLTLFSEDLPFFSTFFIERCSHRCFTFPALCGPTRVFPSRFPQLFLLGVGIKMTTPPLLFFFLTVEESFVSFLFFGSVLGKIAKVGSPPLLRFLPPGGHGFVLLPPHVARAQRVVWSAALSLVFFV